MITFDKDRAAIALLFLFCVVIFGQSLSQHGIEYRDDEIFYVKSTQEMLRTGDVLSPTYFGQDRFQKPILYYWLILLSYKLFGSGWFGARFVAVIFAAMTVCVTWLIGKQLFNRRVATLGSMILMTIPLFFRHAKNAVPDMPLNFFIVLAMYAAIKFLTSDEKNKYSYLFFLACGLGFMIKGFAAVIFPILTFILYSFLAKESAQIKQMKFARGAAVMLMIIVPWFLFMIYRHGQGYLDYMLVDETKNRLLGVQGGNVVLTKLAAFIEHVGYYCQIILSYFAPWSVFAFIAIIWGSTQTKLKQGKLQPVLFLIIWIATVFLFFSFMYSVINHYMLVLSTPFALILSYFFLREFDDRQWFSGGLSFVRKHFLMFILGVGIFAYSFLSVFLAGLPKWWLLVYFSIYAGLLYFVYRKHDLIKAPLALAFFMIFVISQTSVMNQAKVTAHPTLQQFAYVITQDKSDNYLVGVGSHDLHEKEFQVYLDNKIEKVADSERGRSIQLLSDFFAIDKKLYCLILEKDLNAISDDLNLKSYRIVREDYIIRKRMYIDQGFFIALLKLDRNTIQDYLMEKVILIQKDLHA